MVQKLNCDHWSGVRVERFEGHGIESRMFKNRDKQMTFIVRVMGCCLLEIRIVLQTG